MSILSINSLSHSFGDKHIFKDTTVRLLRGEHVGIVGVNGIGKSTLMNIITGQLLADQGTIEWSNNIKFGYLDQHISLHKYQSIREVLQAAFQSLYDKEAVMNDLYHSSARLTGTALTKALHQASELHDYLVNNEFFNIDSKIEAVAAGLGLKELGLTRPVNQLSGGQRTKLLLGKLLLESPDILLLDEPTNYLDEAHIQWLKTFLSGYEKAFIIISHNTGFLNNIVNVVWHIENSKIVRYIGDYNQFLQSYEMNKKQIRAEFIKQQKEIAKLEDYIRRNKARAATAKQAKSRQKKLDKIERIEIITTSPQPTFSFMFSRPSAQLIFETAELVIGYQKPLTKPLNLKMERGQKIALIGANGIGKTTLLKSLLKLIQPLSGQINIGQYQYVGYLEQEVNTPNTSLVIDDVSSCLRQLTRREVRSALAKCGLTHKHISSQVCKLSGGEQTKARLCKLINLPSNILVLDEPTNHLDVVAKAELKRALQVYEGSILLVCHEPQFYQDIVTTVWDCEAWSAGAEV